MTNIVHANGATIPAIGFGTWRLRGDAALKSVETALEAGYRHIDTAAMYGNEEQVGEAIRTHSTGRDEVFLTTKVWSSDLADGQLQRSAEASLRRLGLDVVDLLLIHWPSTTVPLKEQIGALCKARKQGLARHIGVSNFSPTYLDAAVRMAEEPIVTNQVEHHPYLDQSELFAVCQRHGIALTSYAPISRGALLRDPVITEIGAARGKTPAQIVLRWHIQLPMNIAIPKSENPRRIAENIAIFDFELTGEEMRRISGLARPDGRQIDAPNGLPWDASPD